MAHIRAEHRPEAGSHGVDPGIEGPGHHGIVGLATEIEARLEEFPDILLLLDLACGVFVGEGRRGFEFLERGRDGFALLCHTFVAVAFEEIE